MAVSSTSGKLTCGLETTQAWTLMDLCVGHGRRPQAMDVLGDPHRGPSPAPVAQPGSSRKSLPGVILMTESTSVQAIFL